MDIWWNYQSINKDKKPWKKIRKKTYIKNRIQPALKTSHLWL